MSAYTDNTKHQPHPGADVCFFTVCNDEDKYINYAKSIDQLEQLTGLDFFCNLPDDIEQKVEQEYSATTWKLSD